MESYEILKELIQECGAKEVAERMGLSLPMIYKWTEPSEGLGSGSANPLDRVEVLLQCGDHSNIIHWLCERAQGFFVKNPKPVKPDPHQVVPGTNKIVQEFADLLSVIAQSAVDGVISREEAKQIRGRWEGLKSVTEGFVQCSEQGDFSRRPSLPQKSP